MLHQPLHRFGGRVDGSLEYIITSFRVRPQDIFSLQDPHLSQRVHDVLAAKRYWGFGPIVNQDLSRLDVTEERQLVREVNADINIERGQDSDEPITEVEEAVDANLILSRILQRRHQRTLLRGRRRSGGTLFLGTLRNPAEACNASRLASQLAVRGLVPLHVRIYCCNWRDGWVLRVNITWRRRRTREDHASANNQIDRNRRLFEHLQWFSWNVRGIWFPEAGSRNAILLNFWGKSTHTLPSRRSLLTISDDGSLSGRY